MKRPFAMLIWVVMAALVASGCATATLKDFDNAYTIDGADKVLAVVGRKVAVEQVLPLPRESENEDEIVIVMDEAFAARYEILELVHGAYDRRFVDFAAFDHYGYPKFARPEIVMVYLQEYDGKLFHWKYQWDPVHRTKDGRYAYCGDRSLFTEDAMREDRRQLVGLRAFDERVLPPGAHAVAADGKTRRSIGFVTSSAMSPALGRPIALGLVENGRARMGEVLDLEHYGYKRSGGSRHRAEVVAPCVLDRQGARLNA